MGTSGEVAEQMTRFYFLYQVTFHCVYIHLSINWTLKCFYTLAIINNAEMNIGVNVSFILQIDAQK